MLIGHYHLYKTDVNSDVLIYKASQRHLKPNSTHTLFLWSSSLPLALDLHQHLHLDELLSNCSAQIHVHLEDWEQANLSHFFSHTLQHPSWVLHGLAPEHGLCGCLWIL